MDAGPSTIQADAGPSKGRTPPAGPPPAIAYALTSGHESLTKHLSRKMPGGPASIANAVAAALLFLLLVGGGRSRRA